ncbi:MAG TPA: hemolysin family protein [Candidatus Binatia bacterium]|nr:hemolysin family protein [Candidatus Binatia bacterium]
MAELNAHWGEIVALVLLTGAAAFFAASETALISLSRIHARSMVERGVKQGPAILRLVERRNKVLTTILVGNTIVLLGTQSLATTLFIELGVPQAALWSTVLMTVVILLFGEIIPKTVAVSDAERWALRLAPFLRRVAFVLSPLASAALAVTNVVVRVLRLAPSSRGPFITEDDIRTLVDVGAEQKVLEEQERDLIHSIIEFGDTIAREVMTPRPDMVCVEVSQPTTRALDLVIAEGYSKLPVYEETIDNVIGVIHDRELLISLANGTLISAPMRSLMRPVTHVPDTKRVSELLREMQRGKFSVAIVVDEYGGTAGLVTMEDLLEEIVGEIRDEHDEGEEEPIVVIAPDESVVDAGMNIEDVNDKLGTHLPHDDFETIGGYTVGLFGRLPHEGEEISAGDGVKLRVERTRGKRILRVRVLTNGKAHSTEQPEPSGGNGVHAG